MKFFIAGCVVVVALATICLPRVGWGAPIPPSGFQLFRRTAQLPDQTSAIAIAPQSWGPLAGHVFVACPVQDSVVRVDPNGGVHAFARTPISPRHLSFEPGPPWGTDLLVSSNQDPTATDYGLIWRVTPLGASTHYANPQATTAVDLFGAGGVAFSSGGLFGDFLYTGTSGGFQGDALTRISRVSLAPSTLYRFPGDNHQISGAVEGVVFGSGLAGFSTQLFVSYRSSEARFAGGVFEFTPAGAPTPLITAATSPLLTNPMQIAFGPGGRFGRDLYVSDASGRILTVDAAGNASVFVDSIAGSSPQSIGIAFADSSALFFTEQSGRSLYVLFPSELLGTAPTARSAFLQFSAGPVPSSGPVSFDWSVPAPCRAALSICDVQGRIVQRLTEGVVSQGLHSNAWNGRTLDGQAAPAGIYWASLVAGDARVSKRIVILPR